MVRILSILAALGFAATTTTIPAYTHALGHLDHKRTAAATDQFLQAVYDQGAFSGTVSIIKDGKAVFDGAYGDASIELGAPLKTKHRFPIGSNSKLFTAISIYQLAYDESVDLNLSDDMAKFIDPDTFELDGDYCPRIYGATNSTPCEVVTIESLLAMQSGLVQLVEDQTKETPEWAFAYDISTAETTVGEWDSLATGVDVVGGSATTTATQSAAGVIKLTNILNAPLMAKPGQANPANPFANNITYNNVNYIILGYIVEQASGLSLREYVQARITEPLGLDIEYDPTQGNDMVVGGIRANSLAGFNSYNRFLSVTAEEEGEGGKKQNYEWGTSSAQWRKAGNTFAVASGAGAFIGSAHDLAQWYLALTAAPEKIGLTDAIIKEVFSPTGVNRAFTNVQPVMDGEEWVWAHGIFVGNPEKPLFDLEAGPDRLYCGGIADFSTWVFGWDGADESGLDGDVLTIFKNTASATPQTFVAAQELTFDCADDTAYGYPCQCTITATGEPLGAPDLCNVLKIDNSTGGLFPSYFLDAEYITRALQEMWDLGR